MLGEYSWFFVPLSNDGVKRAITNAFRKKKKATAHDPEQIQSTQSPEDEASCHTSDPQMF